MFKVYMKLLAIIGFSTCDQFDRRSWETSNKIMGGSTVPDGGIPYMVSLKNNRLNHFCGGSILNEYWILTAAHCISAITPEYVSVGTNYAFTGGSLYPVKRFVIHEEFHQDTLYNDIALLETSYPIKFNYKVQPINLPTTNPSVGANVLISGYGRLSYNGNWPLSLQYLNLTVIGLSVCRLKYWNYPRILDSQMCTLTKIGEGACQGDSGGPLVNKNEIVGIISWGYMCGQGLPDVFTRVNTFVPWIKTITSEFE